MPNDYTVVWWGGMSLLFINYLDVYCSAWPLLDPIRHARVLIWPIRRAGSWGYLAGSWKEASIIILINIRENETIMFR